MFVMVPMYQNITIPPNQHCEQIFILGWTSCLYATFKDATRTEVCKHWTYQMHILQKNLSGCSNMWCHPMPKWSFATMMSLLPIFFQSGGRKMAFNWLTLNVVESTFEVSMLPITLINMQHWYSQLWLGAYSMTATGLYKRHHQVNVSQGNVGAGSNSVLIVLLSFSCRYNRSSKKTTCLPLASC